MAQLVEQLIRNEQAVGSSPTISSKTCVNTAFSQVFSFSEKNFKIQFATKNLTLFYGVRFCSFIRFLAPFVFWLLFNYGFVADISDGCDFKFFIAKKLFSQSVYMNIHCLFTAFCGNSRRSRHSQPVKSG